MRKREKGTICLCGRDFIGECQYHLDKSMKHVAFERTRIICKNVSNAFLSVAEFWHKLHITCRKSSTKLARITRDVCDRPPYGRGEGFDS